MLENKIYEIVRVFLFHSPPSCVPLNISGLLSERMSKFIPHFKFPNFPNCHHVISHLKNSPK
jgi:hypothetical protein